MTTPYPLLLNLTPAFKSVSISVFSRIFGRRPTCQRHERSL